MLMLIVTFLAMAVTPIAYEYLNRQIAAHGTVARRVQGWPAYAVNLIVCGAVGLIAVVLPGGWELNLWNWIVLTALIYFGNRFVYQTFVKRLFRKEQEREL